MPSREAMQIVNEFDPNNPPAFGDTSSLVTDLARAIDELRVRDLGEVLELCAFEDQFIIDTLRKKLAVLKAAMGDER